MLPFSLMHNCELSNCCIKCHTFKLQAKRGGTTELIAHTSKQGSSSRNAGAQDKGNASVVEGERELRHRVNTLLTMTEGAGRVRDDTQVSEHAPARGEKRRRASSVNGLNNRMGEEAKHRARTSGCSGLPPRADTHGHKTRNKTHFGGGSPRRHRHMSAPPLLRRS
jgi:hypothetical protein